MSIKRWWSDCSRGLSEIVRVSSLMISWIPQHKSQENWRAKSNIKHTKPISDRWLLRFWNGFTITTDSCDGGDECDGTRSMTLVRFSNSFHWSFFTKTRPAVQRKRTNSREARGFWRRMELSSWSGNVKDKLKLLFREYSKARDPVCHGQLQPRRLHYRQSN